MTIPPTSNSDAVREAIKWFDLVDRLLGVTKITDNADGSVKRLVGDIMQPSKEIQERLEEVAYELEFYETMGDAPSWWGYNKAHFWHWRRTMVKHLKRAIRRSK